MYDLTRFTLADVTSCGAELRNLAAEASSMEEAAQLFVRYFYSEFRLPDRKEESVFSLVRLFKTHAFNDLPAALQGFAANTLGHEPWLPQTKCLTLLGTAGDRPEWNERRLSHGHQAIPLPSEGIVDSIPMIARLVSQFGLKTRDLIDPEPAMILDLDQKSYNVFYEPNAPKSKFITAQDFVQQEGIESCLGFGGMLPSGNLFAVIMFSKAPIAAEVASMFRTVALSAKVSLLPFEDHVFAGGAVTEQAEPHESSRQALLSRVAVLEQLIEAQDLSIVKQAERLERESRDIYRAVFEHGNESIIVSYPDQDRIIDANEKAEALLGYSRDELLATPLSAIHPHDLIELQAFAQTVMEHGRGWTNQLRCETKSGVSIRAEMSASAVDIAGQPCIIAMVRDIGDRLAAEESARELALVNERYRLARELHDSVTQLLYSTTLFAEAGIKEAGARRFDNVSQNLAQLQSTSLQALKEMRLLLYQLAPSDLEEGLDIALKRRLDSVEGHAGVKAVWETDRLLEMPRYVEETLFKVAQEALNNSLKHAAATEVSVRLRGAADGSLTLTIHDNGNGFDTESSVAGSGMGLKNMTSRVAELDGAFEVHSVVGKGTTVSVQIPGRAPLSS